MTGNTYPEITILPPDWPGKKLRQMPGDLTQFVPQGLGMNVPVIVRPSDTLEDAMAMPGFYGLDPVNYHPIKGAPTQEPGGGVIYFDDNSPEEMIKAAITLMGIFGLSNSFAIFASSSADTINDRYLDQVRIITRTALGHFFGPIPEGTPPLSDQPINIEQYILHFIGQQKKKWHGFPGGSDLRGTLGGDGDWAKEGLAFGFLIENSYWGIYRLWSRPWLVTK